MKVRRKIKRMTLYKKSIIVFTLILCVLFIFSLNYVVKSLKLYENGDINNYMDNLIKDIKSSAKSNNIDKYFKLKEFTSPYEKDSNLKDGYRELLNNSKITYKQSGNNIMDIYADKEKIATFTLDDSDKESRLGLLTFTNYKIKKIETYDDKGLYILDIYSLNNYDVFINGIKIKEENLIEENVLKEYQEIKDKIDIPKIRHYHIEDLTHNPKVEIKENDKPVNIKVEGNKYYANKFYKTDNKEDAFKHLTNKDFDPLDIAKKWSLFLTKDLKGSNYGLYTLTPNLMPGTEFYKMAVSYAMNVDITFTSQHTLEKDTFTKIKVSYYTIYNENAFSVKIYFEKNMIVKGKGKRVDKLNDIFYFAYIDGAYRLISTTSVA